MQRYLALLRQQPQYRLLWIAQVISLTGDWFSTIAVVILVNRYAPSATAGLAVSGLFLARTLPVFFISPIAGAFADRFNRKLILSLCNFARIFVVLGFLLVDSQADLWLIYALTIAQFSLSAFFEPAYAAILPNLVKREQLLTANTLGSITWSVMLTLGAVIGGIVAGVAGVAVALLLDAATFALAGTVILFIKPAPNVIDPDIDPLAAPLNRLQELLEGYRYLRAYPSIGLVALVKGLTQIGTIDVMIAVYADRIFTLGEGGATTLGLFFAAHGVGSIFGPLAGDLLSDGSERALMRWIGLGFVLVVVGWLIFAIGPTLSIVTFGMVLRGMGGSLNWTYSSVLLQMKVPDRYLGRVFGIDFTFFTFALSLATIFAGFALDGLNLEPRQTVFVVAIGSLLPMFLWLRRLRASDLRAPESQPAAAD